MLGPAGQELKDRRRRSAAFLLGSGKEAAEAPNGAPNGAAGAAAERSGNQPHASAANQLQVPVVQAESVPNREPGCCKRLFEYIGYGNAENPPRSFSVNANASFSIKLN